MVTSLTNLLSSVVGRGRADDSVHLLRDVCLVCGANLKDSPLYARYRVCHLCRFHYTLTARDRIASLADSGTFREINRSLTSIDPLSFSSRVPYRQRLFQDQRRTGMTEAVVSGTCAIGGTPVVLIVLDFGFMGGSMGSVVGEKVALALEHGRKRRLPVVAVVTSGGARFQEGVLSLMQMAKTSIAVNRLYERGLPFLAVLANPATGQVYASFANLADIMLAEPGAIVGFASMRVLKETDGAPLPSGAHTAESHLSHGLLDGVVDRERLKDLLAVILDLLGPSYRLTAKRRRQGLQAEAERGPAWESVQLARHASRPTSLDYINRIFANFLELHGDRSYGDDPAVVCGIGHLGGQTVIVVGQERGRGGETEDRRDGRPTPEGFRKVQRVLGLAAKFELPVITLIDTPRAHTSLDAEERGLGNAIATTMAQIASLEVPSISVVIGEGGSEGALSIGVADRVLMMENAIYTIISPEDAASILYEDVSRADEVAESLKLTSADCLEMGIVDRVIQEPPGAAHNNPDEVARELRRVLLGELAELESMSSRRRRHRRYKKFRNIGEYSSRWRAAIAREVDALQGYMASGVKRVAGSPAKRNKSSSTSRRGKS